MPVSQLQHLLHFHLHLQTNQHEGRSHSHHANNRPLPFCRACLVLVESVCSVNRCAQIQSNPCAQIQLNLCVRCPPGISRCWCLVLGCSWLLVESNKLACLLNQSKRINQSHVLLEANESVPVCLLNQFSLKPLILVWYPTYTTIYRRLLFNPNSLFCI